MAKVRGTEVPTHADAKTIKEYRRQQGQIKRDKPVGGAFGDMPSPGRKFAVGDSGDVKIPGRRDR